MFANRLAKNLDRVSRPGRGARRSPAFACTTPTCPNTRSRSTSTSRIRRAVRAAGSTCRNTRRPRRSTSDRARARREEAISVLPEVTGLPTDAIYWRTRRPQKGKSQYEAIAEVDERVVVEEGGLKFLGQLHRLPRHGPVPRPPQDARAHPRAREGQALPQPLLLHGRGDGACGRGRRERPRPASTCRAPTSSGRSATSRSTGLRGEHAFVQEDCLAWLAEGAAGPTTSSSSTRRPSRTRSAWTASSTCSATTSTSSARR